MKWMGWSEADLYDATIEIVDEIVKLMQEEYEEWQRNNNK